MANLLKLQDIKILNSIKFFISRIFRFRNLFKYKTKFGNVFLDETNNGISKVIAMYGTREDDKQKLLKSAIEPKTVYVDLGSNIGVYPLYVSNMLDSESFLISIEPDIRNHKTLLKNLDNCFVEKIFLSSAISDKDSISKLLISNQTNLNYLVEDEINNDFYKDKITKEIKTISFQTLINRFLPINYLNQEYKLLVRMDIEGGERKVLNSINELLLNNANQFRSISIIYENHPPRVKQVTDYKNTLENLIAKGFKFKKIITAGGININDIKKLISKYSSYEYIYSDNFKRIEITNPNQKETIKELVSTKKSIRYCNLEI